MINAVPERVDYVDLLGLYKVIMEHDFENQEDDEG